MLFEKQNAKIKRIRIMHPIVFLPFFIAILIGINACSATKGSIVILEEPDNTGFTIDFNKWSSQNKCELFLYKGDELQIEVSRDIGKIALAIKGKNGSEPYTGSDVKAGLFTVKVDETDKYEIRINGKDATGKIKVKKINNIAE